MANNSINEDYLKVNMHRFKMMHLIYEHQYSFPYRHIVNFRATIILIMNLILIMLLYIKEYIQFLFKIIFMLVLITFMIDIIKDNYMSIIYSKRLLFKNITNLSTIKVY